MRKQCEKKNESDTRIGPQQNVPARGSSNRVPARFHHVAARFHQVPAEFQKCSNAFPATFPQGSSKIHQGFSNGSGKVPVPARLHQFPNVSDRFQRCSNQGSSNVPVTQESSTKVPAVVLARFQERFRLSEHAFCWHRSPPQRLKPNRNAVRPLGKGRPSIKAQRIFIFKRVLPHRISCSSPDHRWQSEATDGLKGD